MFVALRKNSLFIAWAVAVAATAGSLYFSEVLLLPPCLLCWYQRIFMYPLVLVLGAAILLREVRVRAYTLPLTLIGLCFSIYHNLLYYDVIPENAAPCAAGVSCTTQQLLWAGFITIPLLSLAGFALITILLLIHKPKEKNDQGI